MPTFSLTLEADRARAEQTASDLFDLGASGVEVRDGEATPMPGTPSPPAGRAILVAFFDERSDALGAAQALGGAVGEIEDRDWGEEWKKGLAPIDVGRVRVRPSWISAAARDGSVEVVLDPGMAFGTGTHPTTTLCLMALSQLVDAHPGASVLDVGTGSGLLAISASKLGAGRVAANDDDPVAIAVARENAERNGTVIELAAAPLSAIPGRFDVVVANILANTLVELAPDVVSRLAPDGVVLLSGILVAQEHEVRAAYVAAGLAPESELDRRDGEWSLVAMRWPG